MTGIALRLRKLMDSLYATRDYQTFRPFLSVLQLHSLFTPTSIGHAFRHLSLIEYIKIGCSFLYRLKLQPMKAWGE